MTDLFIKSAPNKPVDARLIKTNSKGQPYIIRAKNCSRCRGSGIYSAYHGACFKCGGCGHTGSVKERCLTAEQLAKHADKQAAKRKAEADARVAAARAKVRKVRAERGATLAWAKAAIKAAWPHRKASPILRDILKSVLRSGFCSDKQAEVLFRIANERDAAAVAKPSDHIGLVGERLELTLTLQRKFQVVTKFGDGTIRIFKDSAGNVFKSFGSIPEPWDLHATKTVVATIKRHGDYQGAKETVINRLALPKASKAKPAKQSVSA